MIYDALAPVTMDTTTLFASDRDIFVFLVHDLHPIKIGTVVNPGPGRRGRPGLPRLLRHQFGGGNSALKIAVFYLRAICCNRIMWGVEGFEEISIRACGKPRGRGAPVKLHTYLSLNDRPLSSDPVSVIGPCITV